jgi:sensor histidine kinase YesM
MQDSKGYIWISTDRGVVKYDGKEMRIFTRQNGLSDNTVFSTYEDRLGRIWFRTYNGNLSYYHNDSIYPVKAEISPHHKKRIISKLCVDEKGDLWFTVFGFTSFYRLSSISGFSEVEAFAADSTAMHLKKFNKNEFLFAFNNLTHNSTSSIYLNPAGKRIRIPGIKLGIFSNLAYYSDSLFLITSNINDVHVYVNGKLKSYTYPERVIEIFKAENDEVWISIAKHGVYRYNVHDLSKPLYHILDGHTITSCFQDYEGGYWFSSRENGIYYKANLHNYQLKYPGYQQPATFRFIERKNNGLFVGTEKPSLLKVDSLFNAEEITFQRIIPGGDLNGIEFFNSEYYLSGYGLIRIYDKQFNLKGEIESVKDSTVLPATDGNFKQMHFLNNNEFLYNNGFNINHVKNGSVIRKSNQPNRTTSFYYDDNEAMLFLGTKSGLYTGKDLEKLKLAEDPDLKKDVIIRIIPHYENYIICTQQSGIFLYDKRTYKKIFSFNNGLLNDISKDESGHLWIATSNGIVFLKQISMGKWRAHRLRKPDGLPSNEVNHIRWYNGLIWYITNKGIYYFQPEKMLHKSIPPKIEIEQMNVNDKKINISLVPLLEHNQNNISFKAKALSFLPGDPPRLKYRLIGYDTLWRISEGEIINYTNLPAGNYFLQVRSFNSKGVESEFIRSVRFEIKKPFWLEWWFILLEVMLISAVLSLFIYFYIKQIRKKAEEKTRVSRLLSEYQMTALRAQIKPHFIFNCISAIQTLILQGQIETAYEYLQKFSKLLRLVLENSKRDFISLKEELDVIDLYIELEQLRFDGSFSFTKEIDDNINASGINVPYLILQPVIENAIWHGLLHSDMKEKKLHVNIKNEGKVLVIKVEDNGIGRKLSKQYQKNMAKTSMGQTIVTERLSLVSSKTREAASIEVTDLYDQLENAAGTLVTLQIPYN